MDNTGNGKLGRGLYRKINKYPIDQNAEVKKLDFLILLHYKLMSKAGYGPCIETPLYF